MAKTLFDKDNATHTVKDLELDITVKAEKDGVSYAYTVNYVRSAHYDVLYYTLDNDDATHYTWNASDKKFHAGAATVDVTGANNPKVTLHYNTTQKPTGVTYTRGVRSQKGAT